MPPKVGTKFVDDSSHYRIGWILEDEVTKMMLKHITEAKEVIHKSQIAKKVSLTEKMIMDQIDILRGVVMIAYPAFHGLPVWEPARAILEAKDLECFYSPEDLDVNIKIFIVNLIVNRRSYSNNLVCRKRNGTWEEIG